MTGPMDVTSLQALSRLFGYPERWPEARDLEIISPQAGRRWRLFFETGDLASLQAAYVSLFINARPETPCPPYGSFYLEGTLMGTSTVRLNKLYHEYGFQTDELADHIAVELEFLALLTTLISHKQVLDDYNFLLDHLRQWTPAFFDQVEKNDETGVYRDVSRYAKNIIFN